MRGNTKAHLCPPLRGPLVPVVRYRLVACVCNSGAPRGEARAAACATGRTRRLRGRRWGTAAAAADGPRARADGRDPRRVRVRVLPHHDTLQNRHASAPTIRTDRKQRRRRRTPDQPFALPCWRQLASVEVLTKPLTASAAVAGLPITILFSETPFAASWKTAVFGQTLEDEVRSPSQVVYSEVPSVSTCQRGTRRGREKANGCRTGYCTSQLGYPQPC